MSLRLQLLLLQALIVCLVVLATGIVAASLAERAMRDAYLDRMVGVALSVARLPAIKDAFDDVDPAAVIQPIAEVIREASNVTYVVVTDAQGIRFSHTEPLRIGEMVSTDPSIPLSGEVYVGTQTGTLGESWRIKVPVRGADDAVIGTVSVGILESSLQEEFVGGLWGLVLALVAAAMIGIFGAAAVTAYIRRRTYRLEPTEIASLVGSRDTMLHGLSEGIVSVDAAGRITLANDAARELLGLPAEGLAGTQASEILDQSLVAVLEQGESEGQLVLAGERVLVARSTGNKLNGRAVGATLLVRDHTELHRLLHDMDGAQSLTSGLQSQAHEFANTLHVISGLLELGLPDDAREHIAAKMSGGPLGIAGEDTVLAFPELTALLLVKASTARELGITLAITSGSAVEIPGETENAEQLRGDLVTIIGNLLDNALEACTASNRIEVSLELATTGILLTVDDDGPGIPEGQHGRVFENGVSSKTLPLTETDAVGDGCLRRRGIGLALVRRIVLRRGGTVSADRSRLGGAVFTVRLPHDDRRGR